MPSPWCVKGREGWCAVHADYGGRKPPEALDSIRTRCGHWINFHWGVERRAPTCPECRGCKPDA